MSFFFPCLLFVVFKTLFNYVVGIKKAPPSSIGTWDFDLTRMMGGFASKPLPLATEGESISYFGNTNSANMSWYFNPIIFSHLYKKIQEYQLSHFTFSLSCFSSLVCSFFLSPLPTKPSTAQIRRFQRYQQAASPLSLSFFPHS